MNSEKEEEVPRQRIFTENSKTTVPKPINEENSNKDALRCSSHEVQEPNLDNPDSAKEEPSS